MAREIKEIMCELDNKFDTDEFMTAYLTCTPVEFTARLTELVADKLIALSNRVSVIEKLLVV